MKTSREVSTFHRHWVIVVDVEQIRLHPYTHYCMSHVHFIIKLMYFFVCEGWKAGMVGDQWCHHCQDFFPPLWYWSHFFFPLGCCSVSVCMFKILVRTEILLLPLRSGHQTDESSPLRHSLLSAREQGLLWERHTHRDRQTDRVNVLVFTV